MCTRQGGSSVAAAYVEQVDRQFSIARARTSDSARIPRRETAWPLARVPAGRRPVILRTSNRDVTSLRGSHRASRPHTHKGTGSRSGTWPSPCRGPVLDTMAAPCRPCGRVGPGRALPDVRTAAGPASRVVGQFRDSFKRVAISVGDSARPAARSRRSALTSGRSSSTATAAQIAS
jgi:hypothetical protein